MSVNVKLYWSTICIWNFKITFLWKIMYFTWRSCKKFKVVVFFIVILIMIQIYMWVRFLGIYFLKKINNLYPLYPWKNLIVFTLLDYYNYGHYVLKRVETGARIWEYFSRTLINITRPSISSFSQTFYSPYYISKMKNLFRIYIYISRQYTFYLYQNIQTLFK